MNPLDNTPVMLLGQGEYAKAWPSDSPTRHGAKTLGELTDHARRSATIEIDTACHAIEALLAANERLAGDAARAADREARAKHEARQFAAELGRLRNLARARQSELIEARDTIARLQMLVDEHAGIISSLRAAIRDDMIGASDT